MIVKLVHVAVCAALLLPWIQATVAAEATPSPYLVVLGVAQDAGFPQAGCRKPCCAPAWRDAAKRRYAASVAIVDPQHRQRWLIDCTPDFKHQLRDLDQLTENEALPGLDGILLTHAHVGHYAGLIHLGREVIGSRDVPVYAMPRMRWFLESNGPWDQLVKLKQITIRKLAAGVPVQLTERLNVLPFLVPHRDEYSETVGFRIEGPHHHVLYLPDIDKWERWETNIEGLLQEVDIAYLDATFFEASEIPGRDMSEIPHPLVVESMARFNGLPRSERAKIRFIHLNHTNPLLDADSPATRQIEAAGYQVAKQGEVVPL